MIRNLFSHRPDQIGGSAVAVLNCLNLFGVTHFSGVQVAGANVALVSLLTLFLANTTTNTAALKALAPPPDK